MIYRFSTRFLLFLLFSSILFFSCKKDPIEFTNFQFDKSTPLEQGLNVDTLNRLIDRIKAGVYGTVNSLLIVKNDKLLVEEYFNGSTAETLHPLFSVTKVFTSALIGIAIDKGFIPSENELVTNVFPNYPIVNLSDYKSKVKISNLLSMSSGYNWNYFHTTPYVMENSKNYIQDLYNSPVNIEPGKAFAYTDVSFELLSGVIFSQTGKTASNFAANNLFNKIGISQWTWNADRQGISLGANELYLKSVDLLKFAYLFLKRGKILDQQIISEYWIDQSTSAKINGFSDTYFCYGWQKYRLEHPVVKTFNAEDVYCSRGRNDQYIWISPKLNMAVITTAMNPGNISVSQKMFWEDILKLSK